MKRGVKIRCGSRARARARTFPARNKLFPSLSVIIHYLEMLRSVSRCTLSARAARVVMRYKNNEVYNSARACTLRYAVIIHACACAFAPDLLPVGLIKVRRVPVPFATNVYNYSRVLINSVCEPLTIDYL